MLVTIFTLGVGAFLAIGEGHRHLDLDGDSHSTGVNDGVIKENWSNEEDDMEHLVAGGSAHFLEHIDTDLEGFYRLEDRIKYLKEVLAMHAQRQIVESEELDNAEFVIQELGEKVLKPFEEHLSALRAQIMKPHVAYDEETLREISNIIKTSELFLKTAQDQVEHVEVMEEVWEVMEDISLEAAKQDISMEEAKQDISLEAAKQDFSLDAAKQDISLEKAKQDISVEKAKQDIFREAAKQDIAVEAAKKDEVGDAGVPLKEHSEAARKTKAEKKLNLEDLVTGKKKSFIRKIHGSTKNVDEQDYMGAKVSSPPTTPLMSEDEQRQSSQPRSEGTRKESAGEGNLRQSSKLASQVEENNGDVTIGPETYDESVRSGMKAAAFASSEFVHQRVLEHQKVLVAASGVALYSSLAIIFAAVAVVIGILCVIHRTSQARRKINFEGMAGDGEGAYTAASNYLRTPTATSGYQELSETQRALESESKPTGWRGVQGAVSDVAAYVTPFRSKVTPRVRSEYKEK